MQKAYPTQQAMKTLYIAMTDVLDDAVEAQARGNMDEAAVLSEQASVLGKAAGILAQRAE
ncbi:MAG: hypothetical protein DCF28_07175 [Alphaproteobacteria bacterium]|nr:MAG: hypothetical protein DCF28_07175 [Alphaproteobacteria bacterium]PZO38234.1 MAG: hypothetical protein DCE92_06470 [Alphaproteobacteria bacterium]